LSELSTEKGRAKLNDLIEQYETKIDNAISLRSEIIKAVDNEKDEDFNLQVMGRFNAASDKFKNAIDGE
jgi:nucleotide-binding universal stress UspA family protein